MIASKRWIALLPSAFVLFVAFTGCKTGSNRMFCKQTSCTTGCADSGCVDAKSGCLEKNSPCGVAPCGTGKAGCQTSCGTTGLFRSLCKTGCDNKVSCGSTCLTKTACGSSCQCKTPCQCNPCRCNGKTGCADIGCVINPQTKCGTGCAVQLGKPSYDPPCEEEKNNPFEDMNKSVPQKPMTPMTPAAPPMPKPMPKPKDSTTTKNPVPLPAPPIETDTAEEITNPFLRVSRTEEVNEPAIPLAPPAATENYSRPWSDALGLPNTGAHQVEIYPR